LNLQTRHKGFANRNPNKEGDSFKTVEKSSVNI